MVNGDDNNKETQKHIPVSMVGIITEKVFKGYKALRYVYQCEN